MSLLLGLSDSLQGQVSGPLLATEQYRSRAKHQRIPLDFDEALLLNADPVGE